MPALNVIMQKLISASLAESNLEIPLSKIQIKQHEQHAKLKLEVEKVEAKINKLEQEISVNHTKFRALFAREFCNNNKRISDTLNTLIYHFNQNKQHEGLVHLAKNLAHWGIRPDIKGEPNPRIQEIEKALVSDSLPGFQKKLLIQEKEELEEQETKNARRNAIIAMLETSVKGVYQAFEMRLEVQKIKQSQLNPLVTRLNGVTKRMNKKQDNKTKHALGKHTPRGLEYGAILSSFAYVGRLKPWSSTKSALVALKPLDKVEENGVVDAFLEMLEQRVANNDFKTDCKDFNNLANKINPKQAALVLNAIAEQYEVEQSKKAA